jgi:hypothetical protein
MMDFLNDMFPDKWFGRGRPIIWPPHSLDLTALHFFFWLYIKDAVYVPSWAITLPELTGRIRAAVATFTLDLIMNMWTEIEYRYI